MEASGRKNRFIPPFRRPLRIPPEVETRFAEPGIAFAGEKSEWKLKFTLSSDITRKPLKLQLFGGRNNRGVFEGAQAEKPGEDGYLSARASSGEPLPMEKLSEGVFAINPPAALSAGDEIRVILGDTSRGGGGIAAPKERITNKFFVIYRDDASPPPPPHSGEVSWSGENQKKIAGACLMHILGGGIDHLKAYVPSCIAAGEEFPVLVRPEDEYGNLSHEIPEKIRVSLKGEELAARTEKVPGSSCLKVFVKLEQAGVHRLEVSAPGRGISAMTNPADCHAEHPEYRLYWGMLHGHTEMSDGTGSIDDYFHQLKNEAGLDFGAPGDHDHLWETSDEMWRAACEAVKKWHEPGRFVTFPGYEWAKWHRRGYGDRNVYYLEDDRPIYRSDEGCYPAPEDLFRALKEEKALVIPHHPAHGGNFCDWEQHDEEKERLVEIYQLRGSYECPEDEGNPLPEFGSKHPEFRKGYVRRALASGWRVGFTGGGDDHIGHAGTDFPRGESGYKDGLTGVFAAGISREDIWEGLVNRRTVATTGARIVLFYTVNGYPQGSELDPAAVPVLGEARTFKVVFRGTERLARIEIIRNNEVVFSFTENPAECEFSWEDDAPLEEILLPPAKFSPRPFVFYYVRAVQADGEMAWASPVWIA